MEPVPSIQGLRLLFKAASSNSMAFSLISISSKNFSIEVSKTTDILYKDNKYFVPPLVGDDKKDFDPKKNPSYEKCESKSFLAYKDGKLVGRICGLHNVGFC